MTRNQFSRFSAHGLIRSVHTLSKEQDHGDFRTNRQLVDIGRYRPKYNCQVPYEEHRSQRLVTEINLRGI